MNKPGSKRTPVPKMIVKKSGSLGDDSDRSLSPTDIINVKENKPEQRLANSNSLVKRTKPAVRSVSSLPVKKSVSKAPVPKQSITKPTVKKPSQLSTPVRTSVKKTVSAKSNSEVKKEQRCVSPTPSTPDSQHWKTAAVHTRQGVLASSFSSRPLPTRGVKKLKKVYNASSLLSLCKIAVGSVICEQELDVEAKENIKRRCLTQALMHKLWDTLTKDTKKNRLTIEALVTERDSLSAELSELKESLDQRINTLTEQHREILSKATSDLTQRYTDERTQLVTGYESTISDLRTKLQNVQSEHEEEKVSIRAQHSDEMRLLHQQYKDQIDSTVLCHEKEKNRFLDTIAALEQQNDYLEEQLVEKEQTLQAEVDYRVQQKVARYATINAELQSLQDVIDMKNKETKVLRNEVFDLTNKIEDITELKRENMSMRNINEQLEATISMKTASERNLSMTESTLREELGQKVNETNNLSLKCEELHFKLSAYEEVIGKDHNIAALNGIYGSPRHQSTPANSPVRLPNSLRREEEHKPWAKSRKGLFQEKSDELNVVPMED